MTEQRTHDCKRHGITNLFAALDVGTGQVTAVCYPTRTGEAFLAFLRQAVKPHAGKEIHVVLDNLSTHTAPEVKAWLAVNPNVTFHWNTDGAPFTWTATADEILAKVRWVQTSIKQLVENNAN